MKESNNQIPPYIIENFSTISTEYFKFTFEQAEKFLIELVKSGEGITSKANTILAITVSILSFSLGLLLNYELKEEIQISLITLSITSGISILVLARPILSYNTYVVGTEPKKLLSSEFFKVGHLPDQVIKQMYFSESIDYQNRITVVLGKNKTRSLFVDVAMYLLILSPVFCLIFVVALT